MEFGLLRFLAGRNWRVMSFQVQPILLDIFLLILLALFFCLLFFRILRQRKPLYRQPAGQARRLGGLIIYSLLGLLLLLYIGRFSFFGYLTSKQEPELAVVVDDTFSMDDSWPIWRENWPEKWLSSRSAPQTLSGRQTFSHFTEASEFTDAPPYVPPPNRFTVLFSDCRERKLKPNQGITVCPQRPEDHNRGINHLGWPDEIYAGSATEVGWTVFASQAGPVTLRLTVGAQTFTKTVTLKKGSQQIPMTVYPAGTGFRAYKAELTGPPDSRPGDNQARGSIFVRAAKVTVRLVSSQPSYDLSLLTKTAKELAVLNLKTDIALTKDQPLTPGPGLVVAHNLGPAQTAAIQKAKLLVFGPGHKAGLAKLGPGVAKFGGYGIPIKEDTLRITKKGAKLLSLPPALNGQTIQISDLTAITKPPGWSVLIETKEAGLPVLVRRPSDGVLLLLTDGLYKNHFLGLSQANSNPAIQRFYGGLLRHIVTYGNRAPVELPDSYHRLDQPISVTVRTGPSVVLELVREHKGKQSPVRRLRTIVCKSPPCFTGFSVPFTGRYTLTARAGEKLLLTAPVFVNHPAGETAELQKKPGKTNFFLTAKWQQAVKERYAQFKAGIDEEPRYAKERFEWAIRDSFAALLFPMVMLLGWWYFRGPIGALSRRLGALLPKATKRKR